MNSQDNWDDAFLDWSVADENYNGRMHPQHGLPRPILQTSNSFEVVGPDGRKKISDAVTYGPCFCKLFEAYRAHLGSDIDKTKHLMALCTEHLIDFIKWARASDKQSDWISDTLLQNDYLRPEVRNGIVMVLIYTFASIKATVIPDSNMFLTLQDNDTGLGISNRFSLKIYNDPFYYLTFLKISISSLIDAGVLPDNERLNQPKKTKSSNAFNQEEIQSFYTIQRILLDFLNKNDVNSAKNFVAHVTTHWQLKGKFVRNRRFASAWQSLQGFPLSSFSTPLPPPPSLEMVVENAVGNGVLPPMHTLHQTISSSGVGTASSNGGAVRPTSPSSSNDEEGGQSGKGDSVSLNSFPSAAPQDASKRRRPISPASSTKRKVIHVDIATPPFCALRLEKIGCGMWEVKETRWFDVDAFLHSIEEGNVPSNGGDVARWASLLSSPDVTLCLVDETHLQDELKAHRLTSQEQSRGGRSSLLSELEARNALITSWPRGEISQFQAMMKLFLSVHTKHPDFTLCDLWMMHHPPQGGEVEGSHEDSRKSTSMRPKGYIIYETVMLVGLLVRYEGEEMWCTLYPSELAPSFSTPSPPSMLSFLLPLFPQLGPLMARRSVDGASVVIRYYSHKVVASESSAAQQANNSPLPPPPHMAMYQTLGTLSSPASKILERFSLQPHFHDLLLQAI